MKHSKDLYSESPLQVLSDLIVFAFQHSVLHKIIFSKPSDHTVKRASISPRIIGGRTMMQMETLTIDNKALHRNIDPEAVDCIDVLSELSAIYAQINLVTTAGEAEYRRSKSGNATVIGVDKLRRAIEAGNGATVRAEGNNKAKNYILNGSEPFLKYLDISDKNGRIHDKKQAKFRQINRFLEQVRDIVSYLPSEGTLRVCDLCCGKSYLSFAVYHYFANVLHYEVSMTGVDLKADVIAYCNEVAEDLGFNGLEFLCGNVGAYTTDDKPDLVISLHACDTATDMVLERAMTLGARVILSTPCCHHALNHTLNCPALDFVARHSMLRQKLCDAATDAMRLLLLESKGYEVAALELIDPDDTPKNVMLRAILQKAPSAEQMERAAAEYQNVRAFLLGSKE